MRRVRYSVAMSLDGYIADPKGAYDWIVMDPDLDFAELFKDMDTILMGRKSWDVTRTAGGGGGGMPCMTTYVVSRSLRQEDCPGAIVTNDPAATVAALRKQPGKDIWLFGGGELFHGMLELGLVDAVEVGVIPVLLGGGVPMLPSPGPRAKLKLVKHRVYLKTGTVTLNYEVT